MKKTLAASAALGLALDLMLIGTAHAQASQMSGVSHPDEVIEVTNPQPTRPMLAKPSAMGAPVVAAAATEPAMPAPVPDSRAVETVITPRISDPDAGVVMRLPGASNELPQGTLVKVRLHQTLTTNVTRAGMAFDCDLVEPVMRDGKVLLPLGSVVSGRVTEVHGGKRISGAAAIHLMPTSVTLPDGTRYGLRAQVIDTDLFRLTRVDSEGTIVRRDHAKQTFAVLGGVTGTGAVAGAVIGGVPGALIGAGVGAGVSTAWWLKQDRQMELAAETRVTFALTGSLVVGM